MGAVSVIPASPALETEANSLHLWGVTTASAPAVTF